MLDWPVGGSEAMVDALVRGLTKFGGRLLLNSHVERVTLDGAGRATGVQLRGGGAVRARKAVVSNASVYDTARLLPADHPAAAVLKLRREATATPACPSFMHLHVGFDKTGACARPSERSAGRLLPEGLSLLAARHLPAICPRGCPVPPLCVFRRPHQACRTTWSCTTSWWTTGRAAWTRSKTWCSCPSHR